MGEKGFLLCVAGARNMLGFWASDEDNFMDSSCSFLHHRKVSDSILFSLPLYWSKK